MLLVYFSYFVTYTYVKLRLKYKYYRLSTFNRILLLPPHFSLYIRVTYILTRLTYYTVVICLPLKITFLENSVPRNANQLLVTNGIASCNGVAESGGDGSEGKPLSVSVIIVILTEECVTV